MGKTKLIITPEDINQQFIESRPLSYSKIKYFRQSPRNYVNAINTPFVPTDATLLGSAIDVLLLEPKKFDKKFMIYDKFDKRSNKAKEDWAILISKAKLNKQTLLTKEMFKKAELVIESLMDNTEIKTLIEGRKDVQKKLNWRDKKTNIPMIGYQDFGSNAWGGEFVVDLKSSRSADPDKFVRDIFGDLDYNMQIGSYLDYWKKKHFKFPDFIFLVTETTAPFNHSIIYIESKEREAAVEEFNGTLQAFRYCLDNKLFNQSYEFRLAQTRSYHAARKPKYYQRKY